MNFVRALERIERMERAIVTEKKVTVVFQYPEDQEGTVRLSGGGDPVQLDTIKGTRVIFQTFKTAGKPDGVPDGSDCPA